MTTPATPPERESPIEYPSDFPIKVMGRTAPDLVDTLVQAVRAHDPQFDPATVEIRPSKAGNYHGLTCRARDLARTTRRALPGIARPPSSHGCGGVVVTRRWPRPVDYLPVWQEMQALPPRGRPTPR